jgi:hypothetical protein
MVKVLCCCYAFLLVFVSIHKTGGDTYNSMNGMQHCISHISILLAALTGFLPFVLFLKNHAFTKWFKRNALPFLLIWLGTATITVLINFTAAMQLFPKCYVAGFIEYGYDFGTCRLALVSASIVASAWLLHHFKGQLSSVGKTALLFGLPSLTYFVGSL